MKKLVYILLTILPMLSLFSCYEDKGNYDYKEIGEALVSTIPGVTDKNNRLVCLENERVRLNPELIFKDGTTAADYEFQWIRFPQIPLVSGVYEKPDTISQSLNLDYLVTDTPRAYYCVFRSKNIHTDVINEYRFEFIISAVAGWLVLSEDAAGKGDLHIIRDEKLVTGGDGSIIPNFFSKNNEGMYISNGKFLGECFYAGYPRLYVYMHDNAYILDRATYKIMASASYEKLFTSLDVAAPQQYHYSATSITQMIINNGDFYSWWHRGMGTSSFAKRTLSFEYKLAPAMAPISISGYNSAALFDVKNNRFIVVDSRGTLTAPVTEGAFNAGNIPAEMKFHTMGEGKDGETCAIFREEGSDDPYLYRANFVEEEPAAIGVTNLKDLEGIRGATHYTFGTRGDFMFYASGSTVYKWRFGKSTAETFLNVGAGEEIVSMKVYVDTDNLDNNGKILFVATNKGGEGKVYRVVFSEISGIASGAPVVYTGFGKILDMINKNEKM